MLGTLLIGGLALLVLSLISEGRQAPAIVVQPTTPPPAPAAAAPAATGDPQGSFDVGGTIGTVGSIVGTVAGVVTPLIAAGVATGAGSAAAAGTGSAAVAGAGATAATSIGSSAATAVGSGATAGATAGATGGATAGATGGSAAGASAGASIGSALAVAGEAVLVLAIEAAVAAIAAVIIYYAGEVRRVLDWRSRNGVQGLVRWVRFVGDDYSTAAMTEVVKRVAGINPNTGLLETGFVSADPPTFDLPPEEPVFVNAATATATRLSFFGATATIAKPGRPERMQSARWISSLGTGIDPALARDVYRATQLLGLRLAETDNLIRWSFYRQLRPLETEQSAQARLAELGLALSPAFFAGAVHDFWALRQYTPWGDPAPVDPVTGSEQAQRGLNWLFGPKAPAMSARARLQGAADAWKWLQANADLLSAPVAYEGAFRAAGLSQVSKSNGVILWGFPEDPAYFMGNGVVLPRPGVTA